MLKKILSPIQPENIKIASGKPVILTFVGRYLPGYKQGGILRTIVNTVDHLCHDFDFWVVTRDRDSGDDKPYHDIKYNQWQTVGNATVYYCSPQASTMKSIFNLIVTTPHDILYLNSFFDPFTVKTLLLRKFGRVKFKPIIVAPRGEFAWGSLKLKYLKKFIYMQVTRLFGLYSQVTWQASSEFEAQDIINVMKIKPEVIHIARDLPVSIISERLCDATVPVVSENEGLSIIFLSRIAREKNLDYALKVLSKVKSKVKFDIYGPISDPIYWEKCQVLASQLPDHVAVNYLRSVSPDEVVPIFSCYDLFLFPTAGENYGHVIAESLTAGTPVLISDKTSWCNLQKDELGWNVTLDDMHIFVERIEEFALLSHTERLKKRAVIKTKTRSLLLAPGMLEANRQLFVDRLPEVKNIFEQKQ